MKKLIPLFLAIFTISYAIAQDLDAEPQFNTPSEISITNQTHDALLYPNPVLNNQLKVKSSMNIIKIEIVNLIGQTIQKAINETLVKQMSIELTRCEKGVYMTKITFEDRKSVIKKILVK